MNTDKFKKKKKKKDRRFTNRHGIMLIALLAVTILIVNLVAYSYSWFTPEAVQGNSLSIDSTTSVRSERCTFETYQGTLVTESNWEVSSTDIVPGQTTTYKAQDYYIDQVAYSSSPIADNAVITIPAADDSSGTLIPGRVYFRTNIQNLDTSYPSIISLYHHMFPHDIAIAVTYPSNTYYLNGEDDYYDCFILRNAYVKVKDDNDVDGPGLLTVEWFVENLSTAGTRTIRVTKQTSGETGDLNHPTATAEDPVHWLYLMYN